MTSKPPLPDDVVQYFLYPAIPENVVSDKDTSIFLNQCKDQYFAHFGQILVDFIWQKDSFTLTPSFEKESNIPCLRGTTNFGDNIDDEWFIVYLLLELTSEFSGLAARIIDNDGEFLLIESANVLPKWLNPESGEKRVYLYNGDIHVIPIPQSTDDRQILPLFTPSTNEAIRCMHSHENITRASDEIQKCIKKRLERFPECVKDNLHYTNCYVPAALGAILDHSPQLIAPAVQAFYYRDPIDLKACRTMQYFRPGTRVLHRVKMTRCLYAQLIGQKFEPDRRSGWSLPPPTHKDYKSHDLGMKLAHGFEILCSGTTANDAGAAMETDTYPDITDTRWSRFLHSLSNSGYFRGELEGSVLYKKLLADAYKFYIHSVANRHENDDRPGKQILSLLNSLSYDIEEMRKASSALPPSDDDKWMEISSEQLDSLLAEHSGLAPSELNKQQVAQSMKSFVNKVSSHEGAEFPEETDDPNDIDAENMGFIHSMQKIFDFQDDDESDSSSGIDEYGWDSEDDKTQTSSRKNKTHLAPPKPSFPVSNSSQQSKQKSHQSSSQTPSARPRQQNQSSKPMTQPKPQYKPTQSNVTPQTGTKTSSSRNNVSAVPRSHKTTTTVHSEPFVNGKTKTSENRNQSHNERKSHTDGRTVEDFMDMMDRELANTTIGKSFERQPTPVAPPRRKRTPRTPLDRDILNEDDGFRPVDIDVNTVKNMLESYSCEQGLPGPASTILSGMGVRFSADAKQ